MAKDLRDIYIDVNEKLKSISTTIIDLSVALQKAVDESVAVKNENKELKIALNKALGIAPEIKG